MTNKEIFHATKTEEIMSFVNQQRTNWVGKICRSEDTVFIKQLTFPDFFKGHNKKPGPMASCYGQVKNLHETEHQLSEIQLVNSLMGRNISGVTAQGYNSVLQG